MRQIRTLGIRCRGLVAAMVLASGVAFAQSPVSEAAKARLEEPMAREGFAAAVPNSEQGIRELFVRLHHLASLSRAEQTEQIAELYVEFAKRLAQPVSLVPGPNIDPAAFAKEEAVAAARRFAGKYGAAPMLSFTHSWSWQLLKDHEPAVTSLAIADLQHESAARRRRGVQMAGYLVLKGTFEEVLHVFLTEPDLEHKAAFCLEDLDDPRAIGPIAARIERDPDAFHGTLRQLQRARPAHPSLVRLLRSEDLRLRERAAFALSESGDPTLVPEVLRGLDDARPAIRREAAVMGLHLNGAAYEQVLPQLLQGMADPDSAVRCILGEGFCDRLEPRAYDAIRNLLVHPGTSPDELASLRQQLERAHSLLLGAFARWASQQCAK